MPHLFVRTFLLLNATNDWIIFIDLQTSLSVRFHTGLGSSSILKGKTCIWNMTHKTRNKYIPWLVKLLHTVLPASIIELSSKSESCLAQFVKWSQFICTNDGFRKLNSAPLWILVDSSLKQCNLQSNSVILPWFYFLFSWKPVIWWSHFLLSQHIIHFNWCTVKNFFNGHKFHLFALSSLINLSARASLIYQKQYVINNL